MVQWKMLLSALITVPVVLFCAVSCTEPRTIATLGKEDLFTLDYGNFENQLDLFDLSAAGSVNTSITMNGGFFYIANSESKRILQLNSYGELLALYYNPDTNPEPSFKTETADGAAAAVTQKAIEYPFNQIGNIAVDENRCLYIVDSLPPVRQERDSEQGIMLSQVVLRFDSDGTFINYLGQQGPGGTPFPYITDIFTTVKNELVVLCAAGETAEVFWFSDTGYLLYTIPFDRSLLPDPFSAESEEEIFVSLDTVIPDAIDHRVYLKIDYYTSVIDDATKVQSGIEYYQTLLYPFDIDTASYGEPIPVPPLDVYMENSFSDTRYEQPYEFLGTTRSGWFFFIAADADGYMLQLIQADGKKILRRHLSVDQENSLYYAFDVSGEGIISALIAGHETAGIVWWRADQLIASLVQQ